MKPRSRVAVPYAPASRLFDRAIEGATAAAGWHYSRDGEAFGFLVVPPVFKIGETE